jgi:hypothetical protein
VRSLLAAVAVLALAACGTSSADAVRSASGLPVVPRDAGHLHGIGVNPADGRLYLGTHTGTMVVGDDDVRRVGHITIDLMGFFVAGPDHFYSSGHPGPNDDLRDPVGLIESTDGGKSWRTLSRAGQSDFHVAAAAGGRLYGFDGALQSTDDGRTWVPGDPTLEPFSLAVHPGTPTTVLATTRQGPVGSTDGGRSFTALEGAPLVVFLAWPEPAALWAVAPDGRLHLSQDGGASWAARGSAGAAPEAFTAADADTVHVVLNDRLVVSDDGGRTFRTLAERG